MLRRHLQQLSCIVNVVTFTVVLSLLFAHALVRAYLPNVAYGKENFDFFFEGDQAADDQHHPPFVVNLRVVAGTLLVFLISCAVDVGGLAGGALLVPVFFQVVGFGLKSSTGLSQAAIAGASAAALAANLFRAQLPFTSLGSHDLPPPPGSLPAHASSSSSSAPTAAPFRTSTSLFDMQALHEQQQRISDLRQQLAQQGLQDDQQPLVDLDYVLLLTPGLLLGVAIGAVMNDLLPEWSITAVLVGVLWLSCQKMAVRGLLTWHAESQAEASLAAAAAISTGPQPRLRPIHTGSGSSNALAAAGGSSNSNCGDRDKHSSFLPAALDAQDASVRTDALEEILSQDPGSNSAGHNHSMATASVTPDAAAAALGCTSQVPQTVPPSCLPDTAALPYDSSAHAPLHSNLTTDSCLTGAGAPPGNNSIIGSSCLTGAGPPRSSSIAYTDSRAAWFSSVAAGPVCPADPVIIDATDCGDVSSGPGAEWPTFSRSSSAATGLGYVIADDRLPVWKRCHHLHPSSSRNAAAAAAAAVACNLQQMWLWLPAVQLESGPWMKLLSLWAVWMGFLGLTALSGLLPFCSWAYVTYLVLFVGVTGCVTAVLIQALLVNPLLTPEHVSKLMKAVQQQQQPGTVSSQPHRQPLLQHDHLGQCDHDHGFQQQQLPAAAQLCQDPATLQQPALLVSSQQQGASARPLVSTAGNQPDATAGARSTQRTLRMWLHVLSGFGKSQPAAAAPAHLPPQGLPAAAAAAGVQQQQQSGELYSDQSGAVVPQQQQQQQPGLEQRLPVQQKLSLFTQMRLKQQQLNRGPWASESYGRCDPPGVTLPTQLLATRVATDSYFFPGPRDAAVSTTAAAATWGRSLKRVSLGDAAGVPAAAQPGNNPRAAGRSSGIAWYWARFVRAVGGGGARTVDVPSHEALDGDEQPWRDEEPFPVAAASPHPAPSLAAAAAAAAAGSSSGNGSSGSNPLVVVTAAAAVVSVAAGVLSAVTGVAGSALLMPILLDYRIHTQVAMASTVVLVFLSSTAATLSFIMQGRLLVTYAVLFCLVGLCGGCASVSIIGVLLRLTRRPSAVLLLLAGCLAIAGVSCSVTGIWELLRAWETGEHLGFRFLCQQ